MKRVYFLLFVLFLCRDCFANSWTINVIDYNLAGRASVAVDMDNRPIVACDNWPQNITLINQIPNGYEANSIINTFYGRYPKLKVTSNNELALAFIDTSTGMIRYGSRGSWFDWTFSDVALTENIQIDMALTQNDIPHIVYMKYFSGQLKIFHGWFDVQSFQWKEEMLDGFEDVDYMTPPEIDTAPDGRIVIACGNYYQLCAAVYSGGFWNYLPPIELYTGIPSPVSACFTPDGLVAMAYIKNEMLHYAVYINEIIGWVETAITQVSPVEPPRRISLAHSRTGAPGIAYSDNAFMYATNVSGGWTTAQIDENASYPELIFDHNDKPLIAYNSYDACLGLPVLKLAGIGLESFNIADLNNDKIVNFEDYTAFANYWLVQPVEGLPDFNNDGKIDPLDLRWINCNWLWQGNEN